MHAAVVAPRLSLTMRGSVADIRLTRPEKMNALDIALFDALERCGAELAASPTVRAVVLSGEGRAFCAGLDRSRFSTMADGADDAPLAPRSHGIANQAQHIVRLWRDLPMPVIAAVHGVAFGGGFQLMLGADLRILAPDTRLSVAEVRWGLVPDMAGIGLMRGLARDDLVRELTFTGREFTGEQALAYGFATQLDADPYAAALHTAAAIAAHNPHALRAAKRLLNMVGNASEADILHAESTEQDRLIGSPNQVEAVRARLANRTPIFADDCPCANLRSPQA